VVRRARIDVAAMRKKIALPDQDKTDAVGYLRRLEIRGHLAAMPADSRREFISRNRETLDPEWVRAIVEMPPIMSGVLETDHGFLLDRELRRLHGSAVDEMQEIEAALDATHRVTETARDAICRDLGVMPGAPPVHRTIDVPEPRDLENPFDPAPNRFGKPTALYQSQFDELAEPFEGVHDAPWLKRFSENGSEVVRAFKRGTDGSNGSWALATDDEAERGIFYPTADHFERRIAA
jgi:hypothetical protein